MTATDTGPARERGSTAPADAASDTTDGARPGGRRGGARRPQWSMVAVMSVLWAAAWQDFGPHVLLTGAVFSLLVMWVFPLPTIPFPGRLHPWYCLVFTARFLWSVLLGSLQVAWVVMVRPRVSRHSIVEMRLRSHQDMILTFTSHALGLVPGSIVLDVDRVTATLYLHCLDVSDDEAIESIKAEALATEAAIIRAIGSREDRELLRRYPVSAPPFEQIDVPGRPAPHRPDAEEPPSAEVSGAGPRQATTEKERG